MRHFGPSAAVAIPITSDVRSPNPHEKQAMRTDIENDESHRGIDFVGDIHGHASKLDRLLRTLGYDQKDGVPTHPERTVVFLGDYVDRGPEIRRTLEIVRAMTDAGAAAALMGNHEYNTIAWFTPRPDRTGEPCRRHTEIRRRLITPTLEAKS